MSTNTNTIESLKVRFHNADDARIVLLARALELGADDALIVRLADAKRLFAQGQPVSLPAGRFAHTSRAKGWARLGRGDSARWGDLGRGGYRVSECGVWTVYSSDGFKREERQTWELSSVSVGAEAWHIVEPA